MDLHIGTSGFSFPGWRAQVYPHTLKTSHMFDYYCRNLRFDTVELNSPFYVMPNPRSMHSLTRRSPDNFRFITKLYHAFTHNTDRATPQAFDAFRRGLTPLADSGKLAGLLAQFPLPFQPGKKSCDWLLFLRDMLAPYPLFIEFRHRLWNNSAVFSFLRRHRLGYCITDLPPISPLHPFVPFASNTTAYLRLHGRNPNWFRPSTSRYDYTYSDAELRAALASLNRIHPTIYQAFVFFNNCHAGQAVRAALRLRQIAAQNVPLPI